MTSCQRSNLYISKDAYCIDDYIYIEPKLSGPNQHIDIVITALSHVKSENITKITVYTHDDVKESLFKNQVFTRDIFPYFIDLDFKIIDLSLLENGVQNVKNDLGAMNPSHQKKFLELQKNMSKHFIQYKVSQLKKGS